MALTISEARFRWALTVWENRMKWFHRGSEAEDKIVAQAGEMLIEGIANADDVNTVKALHGRDRREQFTVEQVEEMRREVELRKFGFRRN